MVGFDGVQTTKADTEDNARVVCVGVGDFVLGVFKQHLGRGHCKLGKAIHAPGLLHGHEVFGDKVFYFTGNAGIVGGGVKKRDGRDARLACEQFFPGALNIIGERRNAAYAGDYYAGTGHACSL